MFMAGAAPDSPVAMAREASASTATRTWVGRFDTMPSSSAARRPRYG